MTDLVQQLIRQEILDLSAYQVQPAQNVIKLDAMENPYGWDADTQTKWLATLQRAELNRYPDPRASQVLPVLRAVMAVPDDMEIMLGNGSDELIQIILMSLQKGSVVMAPAPSFVMYQMISQLVGLHFVDTPLMADFSLDQEAILSAIAIHQPAIIFLANPNNPTGNLFDRTTVAAIIRAAPGLVVLDEAYHSFASDSFMADLEKHDNLLVMRTVSKMGLAGIRLGMLAGQAKWINEFDKLRLPYNINVLTQVTAKFILIRKDILLSQAEQIKQDRSSVFNALSKMPTVTAYPSEANFILFKVADATMVHKKLLQAGVLIKHLHGSHPMLADCLRVSIGTPAENKIFLQELTKILG